MKLRREARRVESFRSALRVSGLAFRLRLPRTLSFIHNWNTILKMPVSITLSNTGLQNANLALGISLHLSTGSRCPCHRSVNRPPERLSSCLSGCPAPTARSVRSDSMQVTLLFSLYGLVLVVQLTFYPPWPPAPLSLRSTQTANHTIL